MTRTPSHAPHLAAPAGELRVESAAIYALVAGLRVRSYEDLLAPHWAVADSALPGPHLPRMEPAQRRSHVMIALPAAAGSVRCEGDVSLEGARSIAIVPMTPDSRSTGPALRRPALLAGRGAMERGWVSRLYAVVHAALRSLGTRGALRLRTWRSTLAGRWPARRQRA